MTLSGSAVMSGYGSGDSTFGVALLAAAGAAAAYQRFKDRRIPTPGTVEHAKLLYEEDKIDEEELERRLNVLVDPEAERIREATERVSGIGESTSWDLAARFDTLDELRTASVDDLSDVPNIGEKRAKALKEQL